MSYNPKTNWQLNDTVMPADMNRIEQGISDVDTNKRDKTDVIPIDKGGTGATTVNGAIDNLGIMVTGTKNVYVSTLGSDVTGDGTQNNPYRTITKALSTIPKNLNNSLCSVIITAGTYAESVSISGYHGGFIIINSAGAVTINGLTISNSNVFIRTNSLTVGSSNVYVLSGSNVEMSYPLTISGGSTGLSVDGGSNVRLSTLTLTGQTNTGVAVLGCSRVLLYQVTATGNNGAVFLQASHGSTLCYNASSYTGFSTQFVTASGGRIYVGSQTQIPNY